jgi:hypothetical protein
MSVRIWDLVCEGILKHEPPTMAPVPGLSALEKFLFVNPLRKVYSRAKQPESSDILESLVLVGIATAG